MQTLNHKAVEIALDHVSGSNFESFFQSFWPALAGTDFIPLGGMHDGGADAFLGESMFEEKKAEPSTFFQASVQQTHRPKIRQTVQRLREFGRTPKTVVYVTSRQVTGIDAEEAKLSEELGVFIRIRDRKWIVSNINHSSETITAFETYLRPEIAFLEELGGAKTIGGIHDRSARTMCVFLGQEVDRRRGNTELLVSVTDSLILWALEGTDPDKDEFLTRDEILAKIETALPSAKHFIRGEIDHRLAILASKGNPSGREVRWHKKDDHYCLPYETRTLVAAENTEDEFLKLQVLSLFEDRARSRLEATESTLDPADVANLTLRAIDLTFEKEGLELAEFLTGENSGQYAGTIADQVDNAIEELGLEYEQSVIAKEVAIIILRQAFYTSTEEERVYFGKLSRTYTLLFTLRNEPRVVEYFKSMSSNFVLYVGSDIIIRALSERYLAAKDQMTINMLRLLNDAGSSLILSESVLDEVHAHLKGSDFEFKNYFLELEPYVDKDIVRHADKILIRAYFYAKFDPLSEEIPAGWKSFVGSMCTYEDLHHAKGREQIKHYLQHLFGMDFASNEDLAALVDPDEVNELAENIKPIKNMDVLAVNDARLILAVYGKRKSLKEDHKPNPYGYRTWWLTHETRVRGRTGKLVAQRGSFYIMRPEFILNFIALSPSTDEVRRSYETVFPTLLGVKLSNRMREDIFHDVMNRAKEVNAVDPARAKVMMEDMSNRLKGDHFKVYEAKLEEGPLEPF